MGISAGSLLYTFAYSVFDQALSLWIYSVYVSKPFRGKKVFNCMFEEVKVIAAHSKGAKLCLIVDPGNLVAVRVYSRLGFLKCPWYYLERDFYFDVRVRQMSGMNKYKFNI